MQSLRQFFRYLRSSLWFIPGLMLFGSIFMALLLVEIDSGVDRKWLINYPRIFGLGADGSRGMLTAIAGSMLTVAALAFSLTLSIIAQASGQYTPRILRNFMRDRVNQFILGYFVSVFAYCLIILRTIRGADELQFVPSLGVIVGLVLAIGGIIVLIYFIHHIASSLQVTNIVNDIREETTEVIDRIFPEKLGRSAEEEELERADELLGNAVWYRVRADKSGYIQFVDTEEMMEFAVDRDLLLRMEYGVGQFVAEGTTVVSITKDPSEADVRRINGALTISRYRTIEQDVGYGIRQIVDIAIKALSPGINDTTTAINCIDYLSVIVGRLAERRLPARVRVRDGKVRIFARAPDFRKYVEDAFDQIRINGKGNLAVLLRLLRAYSSIAEKTEASDRLAVLREQVQLTREFAGMTLQTDYEKDIFERDVSEKLREISVRVGTASEDTA